MTAADGDEGGRGSRPVVVVVSVVAAAVLAAGAVLALERVQNRVVSEAPAAVLDAHAVSTGTAPRSTPAPVPGTTRLVLLGPRPLVDTRGSTILAPGGGVDLGLSGLPPGSSAVLLEVSIVDAAGPGAVTVGATTALRAPRAGARTSATVMVPLGADGDLRARTEGGGHIVVTLIGAFEPAASSGDGRLVAVPATEVVRLVPRTDGPDATIDVEQVPGLAGSGAGAVLLQVFADVGPNGGFVTVAAGGRLDQTVFWSATAVADRSRTGFLVVPVRDRSIRLHYEAGTELRARVVGFVTGARATPGTAGLVVPGDGSPLPRVAVAPGAPVDVAVAPASGAVPADRVAAVFAGVAVTGEPGAEVVVHDPGAPAPGTPTVTAGGATPRSSVAFMAAKDGVVRVGAPSGAEVTITSLATVING